MGAVPERAGHRRGAVRARRARSDEILWLYGEWDTLYPMAHSRENFAASRAAGAKGVVWGAVVDGYLARRGLPNVR